MKVRELPGRLIVGGYVLHTGIEKWKGDEATAEMVHTMAANAYPAFTSMAPKSFLRMLAAGEIATGVALLSPAVPTALAGAALSGFSAGLLGLYHRVFLECERRKHLAHASGNRNQQRLVDVCAIGLGLIADALTRGHRKKK